MEGFVHPDFAPVTEKVQQLMSKKSARGGMAVAVYHHGELVVDAWTGVRNIAGDPWLRETMSMSFSTTKGVVATIVQRPVDQGMLDYDVPATLVDAACAVTPGLESPTVSHLQNRDWFAVRAMVPRSGTNAVMDELYDLGARAILVTDITACRL